ncbi:MAG: PQQ-binding-like beta-propeller repeat protein [Candidatus Glassbacteria bacterium]|nr:PQQ-binding-like beta-propeller repeat protein [Candidatus Glassbacteria bacterium]
MQARTLKMTLPVLLLAGCAYAAGAGGPWTLGLDFSGFVEAAAPERLSVGPGGEVFILDRTNAVLSRVSPETGKALWQIDGSESGRPFVDPAFLSRGDGFFVYLTDRGSRRIWRIDYRGELRGSIDLPFAEDPVLLELVAGSQLAVYDRSTARVHLLDDSGRPLWSFAAGGGRRAAEPVDIAVSADEARLYLLWPGGKSLTEVDIFGRTAREIGLEFENFTPARVTAAAAGGSEWLCLTDRRSRLLMLETATRAWSELQTGLSPVWDICAPASRPGTVYLLAGSPAVLKAIDLEQGK